MKWNNFSVLQPEESGLYLVNLIIKKSTESSYIYVAWYHKTYNQWYKNDPFDSSGIEREKIRNRVISWASEIEDYIG